MAQAPYRSIAKQLLRRGGRRAADSIPLNLDSAFTSFRKLRDPRRKALTWQEPLASLS